MLRTLLFTFVVLFSINKLHASVYSSGYSSEISISLFLSSSKNFLSFAQNSERLSIPEDSLYLADRVAHIEWVNDLQFRLHFATPIHIDVIDKETQKVTSEKIFRHVLIKADKETVEKLYALTQHPNLTTNSKANEQITEIIERADSQDLDSLIKEFAEGQRPPVISQRLGFAFSLNIDAIGRPEGVESQRTHVLSKIISDLSWTDRARETNIQSTPLNLVQDVFTKDNPLIVNYLSALRNIEGRKQQLEHRRWIKPLIPYHAQLSIASPLNKRQSSASNNVVPFKSKISCDNLFSIMRTY